MESNLLKAIEASDPIAAAQCLRKAFETGNEPWEIHLTLFPVVQRVLNPPFHNPHLPKMYRIYREFVPFLNRKEVQELVSLEVNEYARRPKLDKLPRMGLLSSIVSFSDIENAILKQDWEKSAVSMASFHVQQGGMELARRLLLLGSNYLQRTLGHSISCTAFILLEMLDRPEEDPWTVLATLSDYFCKGEFTETPALRREEAPSAEIASLPMAQATSGRGIVNLHHTITRYALDRVWHLFTREEGNHMLAAWREFMGDKMVTDAIPDSNPAEQRSNDTDFYSIFRDLDPKSTTSYLRRILPDPETRRKIHSFLIKGVCDLYQNDYNPHYLTGLGSALWAVDKYWNELPVAINALFQYVDYFFTGLKSAARQKAE